MIRRALKFILLPERNLLGSVYNVDSSVPCNRLVCSVGIACSAAALLLMPAHSLADALILQPSVRLEGIYDDNFRLESETPDAVGAARISPALRVSRVTDTTDLAALLRVDGNFYFGDDEERPLDNQSNQLLDLSYFRVGELSRLGGVLSFRRDTLLRTVRGNEDTDDVIEGPDIGEDVDEGLTQANIERRRLVVSPSYNRLLTERTEVGLSYEFSDVSLSDVPPEASDPDDPADRVNEYQTHEVGAELLRRVTERDRLALVFDGQRYETDDNLRQLDNYELQAGVIHDFSETTTGLFTVGARYTDFEILDGSVEQGEERGNDTGFAATLSATKRTGLTTYTGTIERTATPSISGNLVESDQIIFNLSRLLSERFTFLLRSRIFETEAITETASAANRRYLSIQPRLRYELSPAWALETAYEYRREKEFDNDESADSNAVFVTLVYERPVEVEPADPVYDLEDEF